MTAIDGTMTGRQLALQLQKAFPGKDWMAELAAMADDTRDTVEWHLQEDMVPPQHIGQAAGDLSRRGSEGNGDMSLPQGDVAPDDLPFAGVPNFLGKLNKD